ncbi:MULTISPECIES: hypothetical protein [Mesorhizobium]|uniref:hypothetical protein n=1 Tax=Mesorhizobium TaxID=68287 RepID=UPI0007A95CB1|nr:MULTISPECIES: hypothetical protein [Mesorhizobium]AMX93663.1 hypothetical protein A4R28_11415 [Mesorhizobium ciceri]MDF3208355.1 hypothetical protein [Mesorhizobium sp. LMG15046]MDF3229073.1 hypothetical protein [Mesorhizobium sp. DSM 30133]RUU22185.1 hypothetical protein EOC84_03475 [Mesorhizobium sp. Primo-B]RUU37905.1 hypothetical protein EOC83_16740 [Mesorhizobium sp. Primo-A]
MDGQAYDPTQSLWSIMTKSRGGTVSVIRDLTLEQVSKTYERLDPWYGMKTESLMVHKDYLLADTLGIAFSGSTSIGRHESDGDIEIREVFGPAGWSGFNAGDVGRWPRLYAIFTDAEGDILPDEFQEHPEIAERYRRQRKVTADLAAEYASPPLGREQIMALRRAGWSVDEIDAARGGR